MSKKNVLFVCGQCKKRSPTAEKIYSKDERINVRSAGVSNSARIKISQKTIEWADIIIVMENEYKKKIVELYSQNMELPKIYNLNIPDDFEYMDEELCTLIISSVEDLIS